MPTPAARAPDLTKSDTVVAIRASVARLSPLSLRRLREGLFRLELAVAGLWVALTGASISGSGAPLAGVGPAADQARYVLRRLLRQLNGSRELVLDLAENRPIRLVMRVLEDQLTRADEIALAQLRHDLDGVAGRIGCAYR